MTYTVLLFSLPLLFLGGYFYYVLLTRYRQSKETAEDVTKITRIGIAWLLLLAGTAYVISSNPDFVLFSYDFGDDTYPVTILQVLGLITIGTTGFLLVWILEGYLKATIDDATHERGYKAKEVARIVRPVVFTLVVMLLSHLFKVNFFIWQKAATASSPAFDLTLSMILHGILFLLTVRAGVWLLTRRILPRYYRHKELSLGARFAINQLLSYLIYLIVFVVLLENSGLDFVGLWTGAAALLVGVGIGLQQTFNDLLSGIILLLERSVQVGDMLEVDGLVGRVQKISTRTSLIETRDNVTIIIPNSKIVGDKAINWSHHDNKARFYVEVGVAYGSTPKSVRDILIEVVTAHPRVLDFPAPFARFNDFGSSSLDFRLYFYTTHYEVVEDIKSDLRYEIEEAFRDSGIQIPFPQRDLWIKNPEELMSASPPVA